VRVCSQNALASDTTEAAAAAAAAANKATTNHKASSFSTNSTTAPATTVASLPLATTQQAQAPTPPRVHSLSPLNLAHLPPCRLSPRMFVHSQPDQPTTITAAAAGAPAASSSSTAEYAGYTFGSPVEGEDVAAPWEGGPDTCKVKEEVASSAPQQQDGLVGAPAPPLAAATVQPAEGEAVGAMLAAAAKEESQKDKLLAAKEKEAAPLGKQPGANEVQQQAAAAEEAAPNTESIKNMQYTAEWEGDGDGDADHDAAAGTTAAEEEVHIRVEAGVEEERLDAACAVKEETAGGGTAIHIQESEAVSLPTAATQAVHKSRPGVAPPPPPRRKAKQGGGGGGLCACFAPKVQE